MIKRRFLFAVLFVFLILSFSFIYAGTVDDASDCLKEKIDSTTCAKLSAEERAFSLLAVSKCEEEIISDSLNALCWPKSDCDVKTTAQSIIALNYAGTNTDEAITWLLEKTTTPKDLSWYLQIESSESTACTISYDSKDYDINIDNKRLSSNAGSCLTLAQGGYWLEVKSSCYGKKFSIFCDEAFSTSLIYKKKISSEYYLPGNTNFASAEGTTSEQVNSFCFSDGSICDYESTLWATIALQASGKDTSYFKPYLVSVAEENSKYLPESFLYKITSQDDFQTDLISLQNPSGYWDESGNKFYDTAVALYSLQGETSQEKSQALSWLLDVQDEDGCWRGITETAFLLHAGWQESSSKIPDNPEPVEPTDECEKDSDCDNDEVCTNGKCESIKTENECEKDSDCDNDEFCNNQNKCEYSGSEDTVNYWPWVILLSVLIILAILGIVFRDKLRVLWFRIKSNFRKDSDSGSSGPTPPGFLPPATPSQTFSTRKIIPSSNQQRRIRPRKTTSSDKEFSEVLKKLKDISS